jgi:hypothetical protein
MTLPEYLAANRDHAFAYGAFDCVLFTLGWVKAGCGRDVLADIPAWRSELQAARIIRKLGGLEKAFSDRFEKINPNLAQDGDIGMWNGCCGIFSGRHIVCAGPNNLEFIERTQCSHAWRS